MDGWSKNHESCVNCGTTRRPFKARGLCRKCYRVTRTLEQVKAWDMSRPETLKGYPDAPGVYTAAWCDRIRASYTRQLERRLAHLRAREEKLTGDVEGIDLELQLDHIATLARVRGRSLYNNLATPLHSRFTPEQRRFLFNLLNRIEEAVPWPQLSILEPSELGDSPPPYRDAEKR